MYDVGMLAWWMEMVRYISPFVLSILMQSTVVIAVGFAVARLVSHKGPEVVSLVYKTMLVSVIVVPAASLVVQMNDAPRVTVQLVSASSESLEQKVSLMKDADLTGSHIMMETSGAVISSVPDAMKPGTTKTVRAVLPFEPTFVVSAGSALVYAWVLIGLIGLVRLVSGWRYVRSLRLSTVPADAQTVSRCEAVALRLGVRPLPVLVSTRIDSPLLAGIVHPVILIPRGFSVSDEVIYHELAHRERGDCIWNFLSHVGCVLLPLQPLMGVLAARIEETSDFICDRYVIVHSSDPVSYARMLVDIAERYVSLADTMPATVGVSRFTSSLGRRVERILSFSGRAFLVARKDVALLAVVLGMCMTVFVGLFAVTVPPDRTVNSILGDYADVTDAVIDTETAIIEKMLSSQAELTSSSVLPDQPPLIKQDGVAADHAQSVALSTPVTFSESNVSVASANEMLWEEPDVISPPAPEIVPIPEDVSPAVINQGETTGEGLSYEERMAVVAKSVGEVCDPIKEYMAIVSSLTDYDTCMEMGKQLMDDLHPDVAAYVFHKAITYEPKDSEANSWLGWAYYRSNMNGKAEMFLKIAIALDKNKSEAYHRLGFVYRAEGSMEKMMGAFKMAVNLNNAYVMSEYKVPLYLIR